MSNNRISGTTDRGVKTSVIKRASNRFRQVTKSSD